MLLKSPKIKKNEPRQNVLVLIKSVYLCSFLKPMEAKHIDIFMTPKAYIDHKPPPPRKYALYASENVENCPIIILKESSDRDNLVVDLSQFN